MKFRETINSSFGIAFGTAASYGAGYLYGAVFRLDKVMAARAFAITAAAALTFKVMVNLMTGGKNEDAEKFYLYSLVGGASLATIHIAAFRQLNLIATLGTTFLAFNAFIIALENLHHYNKQS
jgi:hypothetical protein